ncbi:MAG: ABC-ATPase domain-containing protein [bacterium]
MRPIESLRLPLKGLDGKDYGAYQSLLGQYRYPDFDLLVDRIPKDPYAPPHTGVYRARVNRKASGFPVEMTAREIHTIALCNYLAKVFYANCERYSKDRRGTGYSGVITLSQPDQAILRRSSMAVNDEFVEARFFIGLPAQSRSIDSETAETMLFDELPAIVKASLFANAIDIGELRTHLHAAEDADFLRRQLDALGLVAFIADGSILPRRSGMDEKPLEAKEAVVFRSPESLKVSVELPNAGTVCGMGIPTGVTLLVGGGYHGKSTLLQAIEQGVYNHVPGDGREQCVSLPGTMKVRAYSGRPVTNTDISAFIRNIPRQQDTSSFSSENASGSTSQAAFISEAIEAGARVLLMDEDTCATNFLIRDQRMQRLVRKEHEPITAFIDRVRHLYDEHGISTVLVHGGSGDYLNVADRVIQMKEFVPCDVTAEAKRIVEQLPSIRINEGGERIPAPQPRIPLPDTLDPRNQHGHYRVYAPDVRTLVYGRMTVDLADVEQLLEPAQIKAIGLAIEFARQFMDGRTTLHEVVNQMMARIESEGLDLLDPYFTGDLVEFRGLELAAVLNRMREFTAKQGE